MVRFQRGLEAALAALLLSTAPATASEVAAPDSSVSLPALGLMGTIPVYWGEAAALEDHINGTGQRHWARAQLEEDFELQPLATLDEAALAQFDYLLLAQPRALGPTENVALDGWVRSGGRLLLFADPMMTGHSPYGFGDPRRPQDVTLLSPLLDYWNLPLFFDDAQPDGPRAVLDGGVPIPVRLAGRFVPGDEEGECSLSADSVLARCSIGEGQVIVLADAALLDQHEVAIGAEEALAWLCQQVFGVSGENTGKPDLTQIDLEKDLKNNDMHFDAGGG